MKIYKENFSFLFEDNSFAILFRKIVQFPSTQGFVLRDYNNFFYYLKQFRS